MRPLALLCALVVAMPLHAEVSPSEGGASLGKLDARYCELDGCEMTGGLTIGDGTTSMTPSLTFSRSGNGDWSFTNNGGSLQMRSGANQFDLGNSGTINTGYGFANLTATNSGRVLIDDDAQVTGTLYASQFDSATSVAWALNGADKVKLSASGFYPNGSTPLGAASAPWMQVWAQTVSRNAGDLTVSTTTSGDVVLSPASEVVVNGPMRLSVQTLTVADNGVAASVAGPATGDLSTETDITTPTASVLVIVCEDADGCHVLLADPVAAGEVLMVIDGNAGGVDVYVQPSGAFYSPGDPDGGFTALNAAAQLVAYEHPTVGLMRTWTSLMGSL